MSIIGPHIPTQNTNGNGLNRLLSAAVINREFRKLLLASPDDALALGYKGERFCLQKEEQDLLLSLQAKTLPELAFQLAEARQGGRM